MYLKALTISLLLILSTNGIAQEEKPTLFATVNLNSGKTYTLKSLEISNSTEQDTFWFTGEDGFSVPASFNQIISIAGKDGKYIIELIRTGKQTVQDIDNLYFFGEQMDGKFVRMYLKDIRFLKFEKTKMNKICDNGHIWRDTDYIYCPYDGILLIEYNPQF